MSILPPATLEGWYSLHQAYTIDFAALQKLAGSERAALGEAARDLMAELAEAPEGDGWSASYRLVGGGADVLLVHFRPTLEALSEVDLRIKRSVLGPYLSLSYDYLAVTEAGLYYATSVVAKEHKAGSAEFQKEIAERAAEELSTPHVQTRLYPRPPEELLRYISFYPMSKRRTSEDNWYVLDIAERSLLMRDHGLTGRRYANRVFQVISGSVGLDDWEWGVTLFARDPLEFKRIVTEMRYDEASSRFGEFGRFFTGFRLEADAWPALIGGG